MGVMVMTNRDKKFIINGLLLIILLIVLVWANQNFIAKDLLIVGRWYGLSVLFTLIGFPISWMLFRKFNDRGYIFAKVIGFLLPGYLMWLMASLHILKFTFLNALLCLLFVGLISYGILFIKYKNNKEYINDIKSKLTLFYRLEVCFLIIFILVCYIKSFNPAANSTEKYMDYGFINTIGNNDYMPAKDFWLSGEKINYYYFGHYLGAYLIKLARITVNYGYNLFLTLLFTLVCFSGYSIGSNLFYIYYDKKKKYLPYAGGIIGFLAIGLAGNFHYLIFNIIKPMIKTMFHLNATYRYSFYDSTRYIGYNPETIDKTIHEFPSFSFILGDLHSHVIDIIFVMLFLAILLAYLLKHKQLLDNHNNVIKATSKNCFNLINIFLGSLLGIMKMVNFWDFPIYFVVVTLIFVISDIIIYHDYKDVIYMFIFRLITLWIVSSLISLPFTLSFIKIASKIALVPFRSKFYQLLVLWGLPSFLVLYYLFSVIKNNWLKIKNKLNIKDYLYQLDICDLFVLIVGFCGIGLVLAPEVIYVVDIYHDSIPRFNTVFKFTYQSFILFSICYGYILVKLLSSNGKINKIIGKICLGLFLLTCCYSYTGVYEWFGEITDKSNYKTLDATAFLNDSYLDDIWITTLDNKDVIEYINKNVSKDAIVLEAAGDSYSSNNQISAFTGRATLMGWTGHEWLWRSENSNFDYPEIVASREEAVRTLYKEKDTNILIDLIDEYKIDYIVIGSTERSKYGSLEDGLNNETELLSLGTVVLEVNNDNLVKPTYVIKINGERK